MTKTMVQPKNAKGIRTKSVKAPSDPMRLLDPYQVRWCNDDSRIKAHEASRRIGKTEGECFRQNFLRVSGRVVRDHWFSSADESAAREYMERAKWWCHLFGHVVSVVTDDEMSADIDATVFVIRYPEFGGKSCKAVAMASNPKAFRSKGGDVTLDEFAHHEDQPAMWKAAYPVISRGGSISVISSHNGEGSYFNQLCGMGRRVKSEQTRPGDFPVSLHTTTIYDAVEQGLVERVNRLGGTRFTREEYLDQLRSGCDQRTWEEEYECKPSSEAASYFPYELMRPCVHADAAKPTDNLNVFLADIKGRSEVGGGCGGLFAGADIGRVHDRFVLWVLAQFGGAYRTAGLLVWQGMPFDAMRGAMDALMTSEFAGSKRQRVRRMCIDATGLGMQLGEHCAKSYRSRAEAVTITGPVKAELFPLTRRHVEERTIWLPDDAVTLADLNSIRREVTVAGNVRYAGEKTEHGHADRATALTLALHAAETGKAVASCGFFQRGVAL